MYHSFLIHSFADGHLGCFQYLAIVNCAAMNIVTIATGSGEGIVGRGVYRSYYKGHKDKIKGEGGGGGGTGWGGVEGRGENADNCN